MPVTECKKDGKSGHKWGPNGVCFTGSDSKAKAAEVGRAIFAQRAEKRMDRLHLLKSIAYGEPVSKSANLAEIMEIGMTALMLHNVMHGRAPDNDGPDFDKSEMEGMFGAIEKALYGNPKRKKDLDKTYCPPGKTWKDGRCISTRKSLLKSLRDLVIKSEDSCCEDCNGIKSISTAPPIGIAKSIDEEKGLVTAVILRPDVVDLHGDVYSSEEVEKACFNFNTRCMKTNIQHEQMADFEFVESFIAKADAKLGDGEVKAGDWIGTMHIDPQRNPDVWAKVKSGEFTGFSVGCKATVEEI